MKLTDSGFITVWPTQKFIDWATQQDAELVLFDDMEPTVYLIEDDFLEDEPVLKKYFKEIFVSELSAVSEDEGAFPEIKFEIFTEWFEVQLGSTVIELKFS